MQADQGLHCPLTESVDTVVYVDKQRLSRSDCMDAHTPLDLCCSHMAFFFQLVHHMAYFLLPYKLHIRHIFFSLKNSDIILFFIATDKRGYPHNIFLISP